MRVAGSLALIVAGLALAAAALAYPNRSLVLRVAYRSDFDFIDPALAYFTHSWNAEYATCVKLVNVDDRGQIVAEAAPFPRISKDGRTYTFTIRHGFRFFPGGQALTAADFAWSIRRELVPRMSSPATTYLQGIVGAKDLLRGRAGHPLGVHAKGLQLTITLVRPSPDFLARLTMPFFCPVRRDTLIDPNGAGAPLASAGPYYFAEWRRTRDAVLRRNPYYHGTRPHEADEIDVTFAASLQEQQAEVDAGTVDVGTPADATSVAGLYGVNRGRFRVEPQLAVRWLEFDPHSALFQDNPYLKRAIAYALDRPALVHEWGPFAGRPTALIIPPSVPGFGKPAPYPLGHPDPARARAIAQGHLGGGKAVLGVNPGPFQPVAEEVKRNLATIGLDVDIQLIPRVNEHGCRLDCPTYDFYLGGWNPDYVDPLQAFAYFSEPGTTTTLAPEWQSRLAKVERLSGTARARAFEQLDYLLISTDPPVIPFMATNATVYVSERIRCFHWNLLYGVDLAALCTSATTGK